MMYLQLYQGNISNCNFDRFFVNMWVRSDDCGTHADVGCREIPADCPSQKHSAFGKLGLVGVQRIYTFLLDSIERFERMNTLLPCLFHLLLQTMPNRCHIRNSNYIFKWS